ncbi:hypothetical protein BKG93_02225 [Rodentibacter ratti]|uniref:HP1 n=1 Tax=Rodentibacter ratti TaxID=1906745 RepID=A0A1V3L9V0_9PAST|nr:hypothetical protein [Rodentibacter ratti]OOF86698.1 hypothetical protein BKG93_02225 [Rodentibacter ratti]
MYFYDSQSNSFYLKGFGDIPKSAVEISEKSYLALVDGQAKGKDIVANEKGEPILIASQPSPAHELKNGEWIISQEKMTALLTTERNSLMEQIDNHAAMIYSQWTRFESEYRERKATAEAYKSANYQGECSRYITDFAERAGIDNKTATDLILMQAAGLEKLQVELANQRMRKYELKAPGLTLEQMQSVHDDIISQMDALMEAYKNG